MNLLRRLPLDVLRLGAWATGIAVLGILLGWTGYLDAKLADLAFTLRGPLPATQGEVKVALLAIDDEAVSSSRGLQPLPRDLLARIIRMLDAHGAAVIGVDVLLDAPAERAADEALADALGSLRTARVVLATSWEGRRGQPARALTPLPSFARHAQVGYTNPDLPLAADGVTRSFRPLMPVAPGDFHLSFPLALVQAYADRTGERPVVLERPAAILSRSWPIRFLGPGGHLHPQSAREVLAEEGIAELYRDGIVLVGALPQGAAETWADAYRTPFEVFDAGARPMSGLELLAQETQTLLDNLPLRAAPRGLNLALAWMLACLSALFALRGPARWTAALVAGMELAVAATAIGLFIARGVWLGVAPALASVPAAAVLALAARRARLETLLGRYASPSLVADCLRRSREPELGGETIPQAVVLFGDLCEYVTLAARLREQPQLLVRLLNEHFTALTEAVQQHGGWVNSFMGDALLVLFGMPPRVHPAPEQDALNAVKAALAMRESVMRLNRARVSQGRPLMSMGIGLHIGPVVAGHLGAPERMNYTVIGDAVNVAARMEALTREWFQEMESPPPVAILLSGEFRACVEPLVETRQWREAAFVRNRPEPVEVYELVGLRT